MKHLKTLLVALGLCAFGAQAQNVVVRLNDGKTFIWSADEVKDICFQNDNGGETITVTFNEIHVNPWGGGNVTLQFSKTVNGKTNLVNLDCYAPELGYFNNGTYVVTNDPEGVERYIDPNRNYTYASLAGEKLSIASGELTVSNEGPTYTATMEFVLENGSVLKGTYVGEFPKYAEPAE